MTSIGPPANNTSQQLDGQSYIVPREPLEGRTTDPEALELDKASKLFRDGVQAARAGDLELGGTLIVTAFLINEGSIYFQLEKPSSEATSFVLDIDLLSKLMLLMPIANSSSAGPNRNPLLSLLLKLLTCQLFRKDRTEYERGHVVFGNAVKVCESILQILRDNPTLENCPDVFGGYLTRARVHYHLSWLHMKLDNYKRAAKEATAAVEADPTFIRSRFDRLHVYAAKGLKSGEYLHKKLQLLVNDPTVHEDNRNLEISYAFLTMLTLMHPPLGTPDDAKAFFKKCLRARIRRIELYGADEHSSFAENIFKEARELIGMRRDSSNLNISVAKVNHVCAFCKVRSYMVDLNRCSGCKLVYYCSSTECQKRDWKRHKQLCKTIETTSN